MAIGTSFAVFAAICCIVFDITHFSLTYRRYRNIAELSNEIDKILHNSNKFDLKRFSEGELAVLQSEIYKMTVRLREQAEALKKDKKYLADSLADISHQIRTPLTSINLIMNFLAEEELSDKRRYSLVRELSQLLSRIDWLISTLLKISRLDAGTVKFAEDRVMVSELIKRASEPIAISMDLRNQQLIISADGNESFEGDLAWTSEAIENILKNCMEHTPDGGAIKIEAKETPIYTELVISDTGPGIPPEDLPHIFERFYKGKHSSKGSVGIGLALARMIIAAQNGTIKAGNSIDGGAQFTVRFYK